ncbi:oxygen-dependent choline dehydrogenase, FAD/NAD(P)-binding domain protein [Artemisia annua]|uniref:Oxygen-dependent choline dehydrogenase, FAD/NAD(P)-binding domain protein n=1 Tax=Artemisia annua TaxID=35608 RepID=A0A2U1P1B0_ARTAN|nr:oxygen-dependent choline dehydrogenase, FAD/NAD(P)-binding domain protein [Artemisia annua]
MRKTKLQLMQDVTLFFLVLYVGSLSKVVCFVQPNSPPDERYIGFTYEAADFKPAQEYDYIIVGGGTAGCPLAATLSENYSVLLLERGGVATLDPNVLYENNSVTTLLTANHNDSPAQNFFSEDGVFNTRGRVLGGGSMINFGFYSRADDYFYENSGIEWDRSAVRSAYEWVEDSIVTRTDHLRKWQDSTFNALIEAGVLPDNGFTLDHVQGTKIGGSTFDDSGRRHGAVELLNKANPGNLKVVIHATVDRILFSTSKTLAAVGVRYHDSNGRSHEVNVRGNGEVILSAGALGSPQLLLVSGLGPASDLSSMKIPVVRDHPFVGKFMADNPRTGINLVVPVRLVDVGVRVAGITKTGPYMESTAVPRLTTPIRYIPFLGSLPPLNLSLVVIGGKVSRPKSSGSLRLISPSDVTVSPSVRFNYYSNTEDIRQCGDVLDVLRKILETRAMEEYKFPGILGGSFFTYVGPSLPNDPSDEESTARFCRETLSTFWHMHGGCLVNKVVDSQLKVIGVDSLRVVDVSTFFNSPGTNPQATVLMLGRYIGTKILNERAASGLHS